MVGGNGQYTRLHLSSLSTVEIHLSAPDVHSPRTDSARTSLHAKLSLPQTKLYLSDLSLLKSYYCSRVVWILLYCRSWCKQSLLFSNSHTLLQFSDKSYWSNGRVRARRKIIDFISQTLLSWHSLNQEHTITHQRRHIRTSRAKSSDDTAIEHDQSDLQTCCVSKQRHYLASSWYENFGLNVVMWRPRLRFSVSFVSIFPRF